MGYYACALQQSPLANRPGPLMQVRVNKECPNQEGLTFAIGVKQRVEARSHDPTAADGHRPLTRNNNKYN